MEAIRDFKGARFPVLTPNLKVSCLKYNSMLYKLLITCVVRVADIFVALFSRALKQLLQLEPRKWLSLPLLRRVSQNQTSIAALKIVLFVIMKLPSLPASFQFLFVGMFLNLH
jgi:hypothetical protein